MNVCHSKFHLLLITIILVGCNSQKKKTTTQTITTKLIAQNWFYGHAVPNRVNVFSADEFKGRPTGRIGAKKAKLFIIKPLKILNLEPVMSYYCEPFTNDKDLKLIPGTGQQNRKGRDQNRVYSSDKASFHSKEMPFLHFRVEDRKDYKPKDDFKFIQPIFYQNAVYTITSIYKELDSMVL